eukprot:TRINITY_DN4369_c0_g1_i1.p1 TRINITY_DN4369_c0_g1~~TRINITY_DN4369_c0_g1_i1.p1  ORF type:complete len:236 (-),score=70.72 TRINITY_DN4369_c0_g1_i1:14-721(-)
MFLAPEVNPSPSPSPSPAPLQNVVLSQEVNEMVSKFGEVALGQINKIKENRKGINNNEAFAAFIAMMALQPTSNHPKGDTKKLANITGLDREVAGQVFILRNEIAQLRKSGLDSAACIAQLTQRIANREKAEAVTSTTGESEKMKLPGKDKEEAKVTKKGPRKANRRKDNEGLRKRKRDEDNGEPSAPPKLPKLEKEPPEEPPPIPPLPNTPLPNTPPLDIPPKQPLTPTCTYNL